MLNQTDLETRKKMKLIEKIALFLSKTQGRDKLCKLLQYLFRFVAAYYLENDYRNTKYTALTQSTKDARKIFRLFKSINQYQGMTYILFNQDQNLPNLLKIISRLCFFFYWGFDNISILSKIELFKLNFQKLYKIGYSFWFFALLTMSLTLIYELFILKQQKHNNLKLKHRRQSIADLPPSLTMETEFTIVKQKSFVELTDEEKKQARRQKKLYLIKHIFDLIPSGKDSGMLKIIFNRTVPQNVVGVCGFMSAAISIYQTIQEVNQAGKTVNILSVVNNV